MNKNYKFTIAGIDKLDEEMLGMLIDSLVEVYTQKFGMPINLDEPEVPEYDAEDLDFAKNYLKKYRLQ